MSTLSIQDYEHIERELQRMKEGLAVLFDLAWSNESFRLGRDINDISGKLQRLSYMCHPQTEWTGGDSSDPANFRQRMPHIERLSYDDDDPNDCPECARSFGPHYRGLCEH